MTPEAHRKYSLWDPCFCWDGNQWLLFCLAFEREKYQWSDGPFWKQGHFIQGFASTDFVNWRDLGSLIEPIKGERFCAGSALSTPNGIELHLSSTKIYDSWNLTQHLTRHLWNEKSISTLAPIIEADHPVFQTSKRFANQSLISCRDPYLIWDEIAQEYKVWITAGGRRWNCPPRIIYASGPTLDHMDIKSVAVENPQWNDLPALNEIERVSVLRGPNNDWWMIGHCWKGWVNPAVRQSLWNLGEPVSDSTLWLFKSDRPEGPFELQWDVPVIIGSGTTNIYGSYWQSNGSSIFGLGWNTQTQTIAKQILRLDMENQCLAS